MVEPVHKKSDAASSSKDIISSIPGNLIAHVLERMPIQDAVKTSILSRSWRFKWTIITQLVLDQNFFEYLEQKRLTLRCWKIVNRALLLLEGAITMFCLYIPHYWKISTADISHWLLFLSRKGLKEFHLINMHQEPRMLPSHLFACLKLKHLKLHRCDIRLPPRFTGFRELVDFEFHQVTLESNTSGEFIAGCPLLERLTIGEHTITGNVKPFQIAKLQNLKMLSLFLHKLDTMAITISDVIQLVGSFPKLEELCLDFEKCKFLAGAGGRNRVDTAFYRLKFLTLNGINFNNCDMVLCVTSLICGSPNLQELEITAMNAEYFSGLAIGSWEEDCIMKLLKIVKFNRITGLENELCLIKFLLDRSLFLTKMVINHEGSGTNVVGHDQAFATARALLKFHRASPYAEIDL